MSALTALVIQGGPESLKCTRDPRLGVISATLKCYAPDLSSALFAGFPDIGLAIPEWNPRQINRRPAGDEEGYDVLVNLEGHQDPTNADGESFEIEGSTAEDPIETHWNYSVLLKNYGGSEDSSGHAAWQKTMPATANTPAGTRNPMHGVTSWPAPGLIWNHNWVSATLPGDLVQMLGTLTPAPPGNPPTLSGNRVWLCIRVRARQRGNVWQIQASYQLSGPYGYVPEMYQRA